MSQEISCGLEYISAPDLQACLTEALHCNYSFIVTPVVHPRFRRCYVSGLSKTGGFTRSDMVLSPQDWTSRIVAKLSSYIYVDSESTIVRQRHEDSLNEELSYCRGLGVPAIMLSLRSRRTNNLARILQSYYETRYVNKRKFSKMGNLHANILNKRYFCHSKLGSANPYY